MRFNGLLGEAYSLGLDPYSGDLLIFIKKRFDQLWCLFGDRYGLFLLCRRFESGRLKIADFRFLAEKKARSISHAELGMLLGGATFVLKNQVPRWK